MPKRKKPKGERSGAGSAVLAFILGIVALLLIFDMDYDIFPYIDLGTSEPLHTALFIIVILAFIWFALRMIGILAEIAAAPRVGSYAYVRSAWLTISYVIWAVVFLLIFFYFMGGIDSAVLSLGLIGAALTFVLQKPLLNILGWIFITYNRMFKIGDRIKIGEVKGYVTDIKVMHTSLYEMGGWMKGETFTGRVGMIPNSLIFDGAVYNYTRDSPYIWDEVTNLVTYESDINKAETHMVEAAREVVGGTMASKHDSYKKHLELHDLDGALPQEPLIRMDLEDSGVNISVVYWTPAEWRRRTRTAITRKIWQRFMEDPDIEIAYPHVELVKHRKSWEGQGPGIE
ncbi:MAG: hypothetical protein AYK23_03915 [Candidatus Proteinoplasmatales archaeon SG8-5]|nr:MAG: hypothetical protein AYK23_03915 [Candidatus Proteinoplasmatales archaeon SG8-5]